MAKTGLRGRGSELPSSVRARAQTLVKPCSDRHPSRMANFASERTPRCDCAQSQQRQVGCDRNIPASFISIIEANYLPVQPLETLDEAFLFVVHSRGDYVSLRQ